MNVFRSILFALSVIAVAGCERSGPKAPGSVDGSTVVLTQVVAENGMLTVDPAIIDLCNKPEGIVASDVSWNATAAGTEGVEVLVQSPGEEKKLWSAAGAVGKARTGPWMRDGSQVILVNGEDRQELARIQIKSQPCAK